MCEICSALPAVMRPGYLYKLPELEQRLSVLSRDPRRWVTMFQCNRCGTVWEEAFVSHGHGEQPILTRHDDPDAADPTSRPQAEPNT